MKNHKWFVGTGFSRGIGSKIAKRVKALGYDILHIGRNRGESETEFLQWDLSHQFSPKFIECLRESLENKPIHGFLYGAGIIPNLVSGESPRQRVKFWKSQAEAMQINYLSCVSLANEVLPFLLKSNAEKETPVCAHISSLAAVDPLPGFEMYGATKFASLKYFEQLSKEYPYEQLSCLAVHPGTVQTDMFDNLLLREEYKHLPVVDILKESLTNQNVVSAEQSAEWIVKFLFSEAKQEIRKLAHGKLYAVDTNQVW